MIVDSSNPTAIATGTSSRRQSCHTVVTMPTITTKNVDQSIPAQLTVVALIHMGQSASANPAWFSHPLTVVVIRLLV
jgi:hypothetical protein